MFHRIKYNAEMTKTEKEKQFYSTELFTLNVFDYVKKREWNLCRMSFCDLIGRNLHH